MARKIRRIDLSPDEWIAGTQGLTLEEEGFYTRIIMRYYSRGEALPDDALEIAKICNVNKKVARRLLPKLLSKFDQSGGKLLSNRCETELKLASKRLESARLNGAKGGRPKDLAKPGGSARVKAHARVPSTINHQRESSSSLRSEESSRPSAGASKARSAAPDVFLEKGLRLLGHRKGALLRQMRVRHGEERVSKALDAVERKQPAEPIAFFLACCEDRKGPEPGPLVLGRPPPDYGPKTPPPRPEDLWPREE